MSACSWLVSLKEYYIKIGIFLRSYQQQINTRVKTSCRIGRFDWRIIWSNETDKEGRRPCRQEGSCYLSDSYKNMMQVFDSRSHAILLGLMTTERVLPSEQRTTTSSPAHRQNHFIHYNCICRNIYCIFVTKYMVNSGKLNPWMIQYLWVQIK